MAGVCWGCSFVILQYYHGISMRCVKWCACCRAIRLRYAPVVVRSSPTTYRYVLLRNYAGSNGAGGWPVCFEFWTYTACMLGWATGSFLLLLACLHHTANTVASRLISTRAIQLLSSNRCNNGRHNNNDDVETVHTHNTVRGEVESSKVRRYRTVTRTNAERRGRDFWSDIIILLAHHARRTGTCPERVTMDRLLSWVGSTQYTYS